MPSEAEQTFLDAAAATPAPADLLPGLYNPMQHLVAAAELLDRQRLTPEARACARAILQSGRMILNVVEDIRQLKALSTSPSVAEPTLLSGLVEDVEALWRLQTAPSAGRLLISCTAPADATLMIDGGGVRQLLNTLIGRALGPGDGGVVEAMVSLGAAEASGEVLLNVSVTQSRPAALPGHQDAALTLAVGAAERLGGVLTVRPHAGAGQAATAILPAQLVDPDQTEADDDQASVLPERTHILIVDDNATNRMVAGALCEMFGCTTQTAEDGVEAVEAARAGRFDLILMDIKMPRMDGIEATRAIRRLPGALGRTPIVALTANGDADAAKVYLANGMNAVVEKPIKPDRLLETLQAVLEPEHATNGDTGTFRTDTAA